MSQLSSQTPHAPPLACTLGSPVLGTQVERWTKLYADAGTERIETDDGLRVSFRSTPAVENELRALVAVEIECCTWAAWTIEDGAESLTLAVTSKRPGVDVIHEWFLDGQRLVPTPGAPARATRHRVSRAPLTRS